MLQVAMHPPTHPPPADSELALFGVHFPTEESQLKHVGGGSVQQSVRGGGWVY
jgi:hypothetical protein